MTKRTAAQRHVDAYLRADAAYWNKTGLPKGIARAQEIATALDDQGPELPLADLHRAWCAMYDDLQLYACASIHTEAKRKEIERLLAVREEVMTELFARMDKLERRGKCQS